MKLIEDIASRLKTAFNKKENVSKQELINDSTSALTLNLSIASSFKIILTDNCSLAFNNASSGLATTLIIKQDIVGSRLLIFPANVKWQGGIAPLLSTNPGKKDLITLYYDDVEDIFLGGFITDYA